MAAVVAMSVCSPISSQLPVARAQLRLGGGRLSGQQLDQRLVVRHGQLQPAELAEDRVALAHQPAGAVEVALHGVERGERVEHDGQRDEAPAHALAELLAAADRLRHRRGTKTAADARQQRMSNSSRSSPRALRVPGGPPPRVVGARRLPLRPRDPRAQAPGAALPELVAVPPSRVLQRGARHPLGLVATRVRRGLDAEQRRSTRARAASRASPMARAASLGLCERAVGLRQPAGAEAGAAELEEERRTGRVGRREQARGPLQQAGRRRQVPAVQRRARAGPEPLRGRRGERAVALARSPELGAVAGACARWWPTTSSRASRRVASQSARRSCSSARSCFGVPS